MIDVLYITPFLPYDYLPHAGGQTYNYYIKQLAKCDKLSITVACIASDSTPNDAGTYGIKVCTVQPKIRHFGKIVNLSFKYNPFHKYGNLKRNTEIDDIVMLLRRLKEEGYKPNVAILEWTQMLLGISRFNTVFPKAHFVASEHDVTYLRYYREIDGSNKWNSKIIRKNSFENMKSRELKCLQLCDLIKTHNVKDKDLLVGDGIKNEIISPLVAFFHNYENVRYDHQSRNIIFYGAMSRPENYEAAIWFIDHVMPKLQDVSIRFVVIGGNPIHKLLEKGCKNVIITGYVDDISPYFQDALCMVAPLKLGAGIKVKVLEAMSAGIPVLTNDIGIEGIPAASEVNYMKCDSIEDYVDSIKILISNKEVAINLSNNSRQLITENFNYAKSAEIYCDELIKLAEE